MKAASLHPLHQDQDQDQITATLFWYVSIRPHLTVKINSNPYIFAITHNGLENYVNIYFTFGVAPSYI